MTQWIPMPDGRRLAARIWLPDDAEQKPVPAVLEYLPYRRRDGTAYGDSITQPYLGVICARSSEAVFLFWVETASVSPGDAAASRLSLAREAAHQRRRMQHGAKEVDRATLLIPDREEETGD